MGIIPNETENLRHLSFEAHLNTLRHLSFEAIVKLNGDIPNETENLSYKLVYHQKNLKSLRWWY
jgi:hypothetical protein